MQIKTCEYEFMSYLPNGTRIRITWIQNGIEESVVVKFVFEELMIVTNLIKLIYLDTLLQF